VKNGIFTNDPRIVLFFFLSLFIVPHHSHAGGVRDVIDKGIELIGGAKDVIINTLPATVEVGRTITIINETGYPLSGYSVNAVSSDSDAEIQKAPSDDSFPVRINSSLNDFPEIEVLLVDRYGRAYTKTFDVALEGNTETPVAKNDRKSEGFLVDRWKDIIVWFNVHK
jgi:hypothetical protein